MKITKLTIEKMIEMLLFNKKFLILPWSPNRWSTSPVIRESKKYNGIAVSFIRKSATSDISILEFMWSKIQERI